MLTHGWPTNLVNTGNSLLHSSHSMSTFCMLYAAMFDHVSLPAKLPFEKEDVGDLPKSSSSQKKENGELLVLSIGAIKQPPCFTSGSQKSVSLPIPFQFLHSF